MNDAREKLLRVFPDGEPCETFNGHQVAVWGVSRAQAEDIIGEVEKCYVAALDRCPAWPESDDERDHVCCGGECQGDPVWRFVDRYSTGAVPAWRSDT